MNYFLNLITEKAWAQNTVNLLEPLGQGGGTSDIGSVGGYIRTAFPVFLGVAVALAIVVITWGGMEYMLSKIPGAKTEGKDRIKSALWGLLLALVAWIILNTINPQINTLGIFNNL